jgi:hypothetical protein
MGVEQITQVKFTCGSKSCGVGISWVQQEVQSNPNALPDAAWRIISFSTFDGKVEGFCSKACLLNFLRDYVPLKSPREIAAIAQAEKEAAEAAMANEGGNLAQVTVIPPVGPARTIPFPASRVVDAPATVPDATGNSTPAAV